MITIPEGWFWMGSENHYRWERPRHRVWVDAFEIARAAVTRSEYARFLAETGHAEPAGWRRSEFSAPDQPVVGVSWFEGISYCEWLSKSLSETQAVGKALPSAPMDGLSAAMGGRLVSRCLPLDETWRLPTEAEWEKACRGGLDDAEYAWGNEDPSDPSAIPYFGGTWKGPRVAGEWRPNGYGLFNIGDNVHEWCLDWYGENYYAASPDRNPAGPKEGTRKVSRGGSWRHQIKASRAAHRSSLPPAYRYTDYGFRLVRTLSPCL